MSPKYSRQSRRVPQAFHSRPRTRPPREASHVQASWKYPLRFEGALPVPGDDARRGRGREVDDVVGLAEQLALDAAARHVVREGRIRPGAATAGPGAAQPGDADVSRQARAAPLQAHEGLVRARREEVRSHGVWALGAPRVLRRDPARGQAPARPVDLAALHRVVAVRVEPVVRDRRPLAPPIGLSKVSPAGARRGGVRPYPPARRGCRPARGRSPARRAAGGRAESNRRRRASSRPPRAGSGNAGVRVHPRGQVGPRSRSRRRPSVAESRPRRTSSWAHTSTCSCTLFAACARVGCANPVVGRCGRTRSAAPGRAPGSPAIGIRW